MIRKRLATSLFILLLVSSAAAQAQSGRIHSSRMVLATADTPPYSAQDGSGIYDQLLHRVFNNLGVSLTIQHLPSERGLLEANLGHVDGEFARTELVAQEYPHLVRVPVPLSSWDFVAVTRAGTSPPRSFAELRDYHVAYINGWKIFESNVTDFRSLTLVESEEQLFAMLMAERVDVALYARRRADHWIHQQGVTSLTVGESPLARQPLYLLMHRRHVALVPRIAAELTRLRDTDAPERPPGNDGASL